MLSGHSIRYINLLINCVETFTILVSFCIFVEAFTLHGADDKKKEVIKEHIRDVTAAKYLSKIEADLKISGGPYLIGSKITWADLFVAHFGQLLEEFADPSLLQPYPLIKEHQQKVFSHPNVSSWISKRPAGPF